MRASTMRAFLSMAALSATATLLPVMGTGCAADRPSRNGVFNENVYLKKAFLVRTGEAAANGQTAQDPGWFMKATVMSASTPNPLSPTILFPGAESSDWGGGSLVRFRVTQDKVQLLNQLEISNEADWTAQETRNPEVLDSWPATNVDIKYRVNLDGEKTNFLEENQELDWQTRQWVKLELAKNDLSDLAPFGETTRFFLQKCTDTSHASTTLVPGSFRVEEDKEYMEWKLEMTVPVNFQDEACVQSYGEAGDAFIRMGRSTVTSVVKFSFVRAKPQAELTYKPLELEEKDPIRRKYGAFTIVKHARDRASTMLAARELVLRYDPEKPMTYYFAKGYPEEYKSIFLGPAGIVAQTNELFERSGVKMRLVVKNFDQDLAEGELPREVGDVRYSFIRWNSDLDSGAPFAGVAQFFADPRTGELMTTSINIANAPVREAYAQRIDAYLKSIGATMDINSSTPWPDGPAGCVDGDVMPIDPAVVTAEHNGKSSLFTKMQEYLGKPVATWGPLSPHDFVPSEAADADFFSAYYKLLPYYVFADPETNKFVVPEGGGGVYGAIGQYQALAKEAEFHKLAARIDRGETPYQGLDQAEGPKNALTFLNNFRDLTLAHKDYVYKRDFFHKTAQFDSPEVISFLEMMKKNARHCLDGKWETKEQWLKGLEDSYWHQVVWHEFGHILGLQHNFMGSVDRPNYPRYKDKAGREHIGLYTNSVMEYNAAPDRVFWSGDKGTGGWGPYDRGAISWIYSNETDYHAQKVKEKAAAGDAPAFTAQGVSGQWSVDAPWRDTYGFRDGKEVQYLFCTHEHMKYTPLCRQGDAGSTPAEIIANDLDKYEWQYKWRNFRLYRKIWDNGAYANTPANMITELRRFIPMYAFDWERSDLTDAFRRIGIEPPPGAPVIESYYSQLHAKFDANMSEANQMVAAFHKAVIQQASGERPFRTIYDKFFGDVTQQGIILDKLFAMQGWVGLWPSTNYDPNSSGAYIASYSGVGDISYNTIAEDAVTSMIGEQYYDAYPYFKPLAVLQFAQDTHSPNFGGRIAVRDWVGGLVFYRKKDMLDYFRERAVKHHRFGCSDVETCNYDPTVRRGVEADDHLSDLYNEFHGPDERRWTWVYVADRNAWVFADRDRNTATYKILNEYNIEVIRGEDDGSVPGLAYSLQLPIKYFLDAFNQFN